MFVNHVLLATSEATQAVPTAMSGEGVYNYGLVIILMMTGIYLVLAKGNMIKSIIGLNLFQVSVIMFYVSMGRIDSVKIEHGQEVHYQGTAPIYLPNDLPAHEEHAEDGAHAEDSEHAANSQTDGHGEKNHATNEKDTHAVAHKSTLELKPFEKVNPNQPEFKNVYSNPVPHVLMLTAIVVGVATTALALALVVRIREYYGTIEEEEVVDMMIQAEEQSGGVA